MLGTEWGVSGRLGQVRRETSITARLTLRWGGRLQNLTVCKILILPWRAPGIKYDSNLVCRRSEGARCQCRSLKLTRNRANHCTTTTLAVDMSQPAKTATVAVRNRPRTRSAFGFVNSAFLHVMPQSFDFYVSGGHLEEDGTMDHGELCETLVAHIMYRLSKTYQTIGIPTTVTTKQYPWWMIPPAFVSGTFDMSIYVTDVKT